MSEQAVPSPTPAALRAVLVAVLVAVVETVLLAGTAHAGAVPLVCAVVVLQVAAGAAWAFTSDFPGRGGALVIAALTASGADVAVSLSPHARLQPLLPVVGLAVPALFLHQLHRRSRRQRVTASVAATAVLVVLEMAPTALLQLRVEFGGAAAGAMAVAAVVVAAGCAVVAGVLLDVVVPAPRFDQDVRGRLPGVLAAAAVGAAAGYLALRNVAGLTAGAAAFAGAVLGAVTGLLAVAAAFLTATTAPARGALAALLPMSLVAPIGLLVLLAVRGAA